MEVEILKALSGGGGVVAVIACVILFNRQITILTTNFQKQIETLTSDILKVSVETSKAISDLSAAVKHLEIKSDQANSPKK